MNYLIEQVQYVVQVSRTQFYCSGRGVREREGQRLIKLLVSDGDDVVRCLSLILF